MSEFIYTYGNLAERAEKIAEAEGKGLRMLHDDFDHDWTPGDEPHGTLTFTDEPTPEPEPGPEPIVFTASPPGEALGERLKNIEDFLSEVYSG